jgi:hypothetical protein
MLAPEVDAALRQQGSVPAPRAWTQFGFVPTQAAVECPWGSPGETVSDAYYAWARLAPGESDQFVALVLDNGYAIEESARGTWLVTPPELAGGGEGATLITADWVAFAGSREEIDDIVWVE